MHENLVHEAIEAGWSMSVEEYSVTADGVRGAAKRLAGRTIRTPLIENEFLNDVAGGRVLVKAEVLQHCGSFKFRGAFNLISQLSDGELAKGILAWSSGNHAQGVARAARHFDTPATIVMPTDTPALKLEKVKAFGADVIYYDRYSEDREAIARPIQEERGMVLAPSYDHPHIIEGQGTLALEVIEDASLLDAKLDAFIICCGGGGLTSGCATILADMTPKTDVWIAEPEGFDEAWASIRDGERRHADITPPHHLRCDRDADPGEIDPADYAAPGARRRHGQRRRSGGGRWSFAYKHLKARG